MANQYDVDSSQIRKVWKREEARRKRIGLTVDRSWLREMAKLAWGAGMRFDG